MANPDLWDGSLLKSSAPKATKERAAGKKRRRVNPVSAKQEVKNAKWAGIREATIYWLNKLDPDGAHCFECGRKARRLDLDHIVPRGRGGHDTVSNAQLLCRECHTKKHGEPMFSKEAG